MAGLVAILDDSSITHKNLWRNFKYLESYLGALAVNAELIQGVALDSDFQETIADLLAADLNTFIPNLADAIYAQEDFLTRLMEEDADAGGSFDGFENNLTFLENLIDELADSNTFMSAFVDYLQNNAPDFFESLEGDVFKAYFGPALDQLTFATTAQENGTDGVYSLWESGEPELTGDDATKYLGVTFGLDDDYESDFNLFVSRDQTFANKAVMPAEIGDYPLEDASTAVLRFTYDGNDNTSGAATGDIAAAFFDSSAGSLLLDISKLEWDGASSIYIKLMGTKSNFEYIRIGFDYATHASQVTEGAAGSEGSQFATIVVNTQDEWETIAGKEGEPEKAVGYWDGAKIVWPEDFKVVIGSIDITDAGASGSDVFDGGYAYKMAYPIYFGGNNVQMVGQGKVTIVKGSNDAIFRSVVPFSDSSDGHGSAQGIGDDEIKITIASGDLSEGDLIHYALNDEYYTVVRVYTVSNKIQVDRDVTGTSASSTVTKMLTNIKLEGFTYDGRGGVIYNHGSYKTGDNLGNNEGGGFARLEGVGNSEFNCRILNCQAKNGGGLYLEECYNLKVPNIQYCEAEKISTQGGDGGGIYGGDYIQAVAFRCDAENEGGGFAESDGGVLYAFNCEATTYNSFYNCDNAAFLADQSTIYFNSPIDIAANLTQVGNIDLTGNFDLKGTGKYFKLNAGTQFQNKAGDVLIDENGHLFIYGSYKTYYNYTVNGDIDYVEYKRNNNVLITTVTYSYNSDGDISSYTFTIGGSTYTVTFSYDGNRNISSSILSIT